MTGNVWETVADKVARDAARQRVSTARSRLTELHKQLDDALHAARTHRDPNLSDEGLGNKQRELTQRAHDTIGPQIKQLQAQVHGDADTLRRWAEDARPKVGDDATSLMRHQVAWDRVRMRLEAGMPMQQILTTATREEALAIREWAPAWMDAQTYNAAQHGGLSAGLYSPPDTTGLMRSIDDRLAAIEGGQVAAAIAAAREAEVVVAGVEPIVRHLDTLAAGGQSDALGAALESHYKAQEAAAGYQDPTEDEATRGLTHG
ncbi:hypothetical protein [Cellulomonas sp. ATA003]|uniref:hypothetical protein n=1 Tax=Cellulomonas sp. ATA003 TaxID=3073064 RepID=UPI002873724F|nr:hypothetical protein [Cellulomonas sp. ATA003]WNB84531.1 hypothetical protein REH70_11890 [Cellulomonas sp. ATA003]